MISESMKARLHALIDQDYIQKRNGKNDCNIKAAVKYADNQCGYRCVGQGKKPTGKELTAWAAAWNLTYHTALERIWRERV